MDDKLDLERLEKWFDEIYKARNPIQQRGDYVTINTRLTVHKDSSFLKEFNRLIKEEAKNLTSIDKLFKDTHGKSDTE